MRKSFKVQILLVLSCLFFLPLNTFAASTGFEDLGFGANSYWNGSNGSGGLISGSITFPNSYNTTFGSWSGFAVSTTKDTTTTGFVNEYSAITGGGVGGSDTYGVFYPGFGQPLDLLLDTPAILDGLYVTNTTYAYLSMRDGDGFAKKFTTADNDWFLLTITGLNALNQTAGTKNVYLADFRGVNGNIIDTWEWVDLTSLGEVAKLRFTFTSSDMGLFGINTPAYVAIDNVGGPKIDSGGGDGGDGDDGGSSVSCFLNSLSF